MSVALCLPNALLSCEPPRLPHTFDTSLLFALYLLHDILLPSVTWLWNWTHPIQLNSPHPTELTPSRPAGSTRPSRP